MYTGFTLYLVSKHQTSVEEKEHSLSVLNFYILGHNLKKNRLGLTRSLNDSNITSGGESVTYQTL